MSMTEFRSDVMGLDLASHWFGSMADITLEGNSVETCAKLSQILAGLHSGVVEAAMAKLLKDAPRIEEAKPAYWRNSSYTVLRFVFTMMMTLMLGRIFWNTGRKTNKQYNLFNALGYMYSAFSSWECHILMGCSRWSQQKELFFIEKEQL